MNDYTSSEPGNLMHVLRQLVASGNYAQAEADFRSLLHTNPNYHPAWAELSLLLARTGHLQGACQAMRQAAELCPQDGQYIRSLCELYRRLGQTQTAITLGRQAQSLLPTDVGVLYNLGLALYDARLFTEATEAYRQALKQDAKHGLSWNNLGAALEHLNDAQGAFDAYAQAVRLNPQHKEALDNLAQLKRTVRREPSQQIPPKDAAAMHQSAIKFWHKGNREGAIKCLAQAIALDGSNAVYCSNLAEMFRQSGRPELAID